MTRFRIDLDTHKITLRNDQEYIQIINTDDENAVITNRVSEGSVSVPIDRIFPALIEMVANMYRMYFIGQHYGAFTTRDQHRKILETIDDSLVHWINSMVDNPDDRMELPKRGRASGLITGYIDPDLRDAVIKMLEDGLSAKEIMSNLGVWYHDYYKIASSWQRRKKLENSEEK